MTVNKQYHVLQGYTAYTTTRRLIHQTEEWSGGDGDNSWWSEIVIELLLENEVDDDDLRYDSRIIWTQGWGQNLTYSLNCSGAEVDGNDCDKVKKVQRRRGIEESDKENLGKS